MPRMAEAIFSPRAGSRIDRGVSRCSTTVVSKPRSVQASAISSPTYPLPTTTTRSTFSRQGVDDLLAVGERLDAEDALAVDAGQVGPDRLGAGGDDEAVVADRLLDVVVPDGDLAGVDVDRRGLGPRPKIDAALPVLRGRAAHQVVGGVDLAGHPVRDAAGGVGRPLGALEHHDLVRLREAATQLGRGAHAPGVTADDQDTRTHAATLGGRRGWVALDAFHHLPQQLVDRAPHTREGHEIGDTAQQSR